VLPACQAGEGALVSTFRSSMIHRERRLQVTGPLPSMHAICSHMIVRDDLSVIDNSDMQVLLLQ
jgi:hypothetical protein